MKCRFGESDDDTGNGGGCCEEEVADIGEEGEDREGDEGISGCVKVLNSGENVWRGALLLLLLLKLLFNTGDWLIGE